MPSARRLLMTSCFCFALAVFWFGPHWFAFGEAALAVWAVLFQIGGPAVASICCFLAAWRSEEGDRTAWISFGTGSALYLAGNLFYVYYAVMGIVPSFPALPEIAYFLMAGFFAAGMFQYGKVMARVSRVQIYDFILIYCSMMLASLFVLNESIHASVLSPFATIVAFVYPALWFSVAASGLISLLLFKQGNRSFPFILLLLAVIAEAIADLQYALSLMEGVYQLGGPIQLLWVASAGLIALAGLEQLTMQRQGANAVAGASVRIADRSVAQAAIPATAIAIILLSGSAVGALGSGTYAVVSGATALTFAIVVAFREYRIIHVQRLLRSAVEYSRADLARSQERMSSVLESTSDAVIVLDGQWRIEFFNKRALHTANPAGTLELGVTFWEAFPTAFASNRGDRYRQVLETKQPAEFEEYIAAAGIWLGINAYPTGDGISIFFRDVSERRRIREELAYMAHHDSLTGLATRSLFQQRLKEAVESGGQVATLLIDLDRFKEVNDTLGHPVGDILLALTADRLRACLRPTDTIARLGGDEFAVILADHAGPVEAKRLALRMLGACAAPHNVDGQSVRVGASVGIALSVGGKDDPDRVFKKADIALYAAKAEARGGFRFFEPAMEIGLQQRQALRADLRVALDNAEFELAYQPLVDLRSGRVCAFEALLRWRHPTRGLIPPDVFIPIAEETGLITAIGDWALRTACTEAVRWPDHISVAVNLSTRQFSSGDLADKVKATLLRTGLENDRLELEITESVLLKDSNANMLTLRRLRELGVRIALDDFGTGFSSLGYLQRFPFSKIKIDRSFIGGLPGNTESQAIVRAVIGLGQSLGMRVTAEGVETRAQFDWVKKGCDEAQGYFLSKPVPADEIARLLETMGTTLPGRSRQVTRLAS